MTLAISMLNNILLLHTKLLIIISSTTPTCNAEGHTIENYSIQEVSCVDK